MIRGISETWEETLHTCHNWFFTYSTFENFRENDKTIQSFLWTNYC